METAEISVAGMTCQHCVSAVTQELSELPGVSAVDVDLVTGGVSRVTIISESELKAEQLKAAVDEAGYEVV